MEPTITFTVTEAVALASITVGLFGTLLGSWLTLVLRKRPEVIDLVGRSRQSDHEAECLRYRQIMQEATIKYESSVRRIEDSSEKQFTELRRGIEGLYQRKAGWLR